MNVYEECVYKVDKRYIDRLRVDDYILATSLQELQEKVQRMPPISQGSISYS